MAGPARVVKKRKRADLETKVRVMVVKALSQAWKEQLQNPQIMIRAFEKPGLSLPVNGSQDEQKMKIQGCKPGVPEGLIIG